MFLADKKSVLYIIKSNETDLLILGVMTVFISVLDNFLPNDQAFPLTIPSLLGTALSLILAFRTSQAYDRWWEARKIWGAIVNDSRSLVRACQTFAGGDLNNANAKEFVQKIAFRQMAWTHILGENLRGNFDLNPIKKYLSDHEFNAIQDRRNVPNALLQFHSNDIKVARENGLITEFGQLRLDEIIMNLVNSMGMCERIKNTVFPSPYNRFVHLTIYVFSITLVIGIEDFTGLIEIPSTIIITTIFFSLDKVAVLLQDPWENNPSDIPVTSLAVTIETDLRQMIGNNDLPEKVKPQDYYIM